jgi:CubicO group peptidase (beta-lactamase class C family)
MRLTRRGWIGASAALAGMSAATGVKADPPESGADFPVGAFQVRSTGARDHAPALAALRDYARAELAAWGLPGMTLAVTDVDGFTAVLALGWADVERRVPIDPGHYFQIGSISKSFIAQTILALGEEGRIDVDAPMARYLPDAPLPPEPVTIAQVLSHTSGLPGDAEPFPRTPDGRLWCGFEPGSRFSYSNLGYGLLGRVIERVTGMPHPAAVTRYVRGKIGLGEVAGTISRARRDAFAVGYWPADRVAVSTLPGARLEFATWDEEDTPAGSIGATSDQMAVYLRALMRAGRGEDGPVLRAAAARRFTTPVIAASAFGAGAQYACGVAVSPIDGAPTLHHTGGMMSFSSSFHADPAAGVACFASVNARNGEYRPRKTTAYAVRLLRAVRAGAPLPPAPDPSAPLRFKDPSPYLGRFVSDTGEMMIESSGDRVTIRSAGAAGRVAAEDPDRLITDHPGLALYGLDAIREDGRVVGYWWGETLFGRDAPRARPAAAEALRPYAGAYLNRDPWIGGAVVFVRGDALVIDGQGGLVDHGGWWSTEKDVGGIERIRFDAMLDGKAYRMNVSGDDLWRIEV